MNFWVSLSTKKIEALIITLEKTIRRSDAWEKAMEKAYSTLTRPEINPPADITELRVLEANAAAAYCRAWRGLPIKRGVRAGDRSRTSGEKLSKEPRYFTSPEVATPRTR